MKKIFELNESIWVFTLFCDEKDLYPMKLKITNTKTESVFWPSLMEDGTWEVMPKMPDFVYDRAYEIILAGEYWYNLKDMALPYNHYFNNQRWACKYGLCKVYQEGGVKRIVSIVENPEESSYFQYRKNFFTS